MPAWYEELIPASISSAVGDVDVAVESAGKSGGRRIQAHEFADVDGAWVEDSGAMPHRYQLRLFLVGDDYHVRLQELEDILDSPGPIRFEHPFRGPIENLYIEGEYNTEESKERLGYASVTLTLVQSGQPEPLIFESPDARVRVRAAAVLAAAESQFLDVYSGQDVLGSSLRALGRIGDALTDSYNDILSKFGPIAEVRNAINEFRDRLDMIASFPTQIVNQFRFIERAISRLTSKRAKDLGRRPVGYAAPLNTLQSAATRVRQANSTEEATADREAVVGASSTGISQTAVVDLDALYVFTAATTLASLVDVLGDLELPTADAAQTLATFISDYADSVLEAFIGSGPIASDLYDSMLALKHDAVELLQQLQGELPTQAAYTVPSQMPITIVAYSLSGDVGESLGALVKTLIANNNIDDPLALLPDDVLQVVLP